MKPTLKPPGTKRLKLQYDGPLSKSAFKFNLRRYNVYINQFGPVWSAANAAYLFRYTVTQASTLSIAITFTPATGVPATDVPTPIYGSAFAGIEVEEVQTVGWCRLNL